MTFLTNNSLRFRGQPVTYIKIFLASALLTFSVGSHADDIDIYNGIYAAGATTGNSPASLNPNVMFILDDSGSMDNFVLLPVVGSTTPSAIYDSAEDYGADGDAVNDAYVYLYDDDMNYLERFVTDAQNKCQAQRDWITANPNNPIFQDEAVQWKPTDGTWYWRKSFGTSTNSNRVLDCASDRGVHALSASTTSWPKKCNNGCNSSTPNYVDDEPSGGKNPYKNAENRNLVSGNYHDYLISIGASASSVTTSTGTRASDCETEGEILIDDDSVQIGQCYRKLTVMKRALNNALDSFTDINVSLMDFNQNQSDFTRNGGTLIKASGNINDPVFKSEIKTVLDNMNATGGTPLTEALYEAYLVFSGGEADFGEGRGDSAAFEGSTTFYKSPIVNECQSNNIILLSDGQPTYDQAADTDISDLIPGTCTFGSGRLSAGDICLDDLAGYMAGADLSPGTTGVRGTNSVYTYTIGFNIDNAVLVDAANAGGPPGALEGEGYFIGRCTSQCHCVQGS